MKEHRIFKPDLMLDDTIKSSWCQNIKTINDKLPINQFLKNKGIFALDIFPISTEQFYVFALPINKNWEAQTFTENINLYFSIFTESPLDLNIIFQDIKEQNTLPVKVIIDSKDIDMWKEFTIPVSIKQDLRLVIFSGSAEHTSNYVIRDIVLKN
jgi:hypothetical protein